MSLTTSRAPARTCCDRSRSASCSASRAPGSTPPPTRVASRRFASARQTARCGSSLPISKRGYRTRERPGRRAVRRGPPSAGNTICCQSGKARALSPACIGLDRPPPQGLEPCGLSLADCGPLRGRGSGSRTRCARGIAHAGLSVSSLRFAALVQRHLGQRPNTTDRADPVAGKRTRETPRSNRDQIEARQPLISLPVPDPTPGWPDGHDPVARGRPPCAS